MFSARYCTMPRLTERRDRSGSKRYRMTDETNNDSFREGIVCSIASPLNRRIQETDPGRLCRPDVLRPSRPVTASPREVCH